MTSILIPLHYTKAALTPFHDGLERDSQFIFFLPNDDPVRLLFLLPSYIVLIKTLRKIIFVDAEFIQ